MNPSNFNIYLYGQIFQSGDEESSHTKIEEESDTFAENISESSSTTILANVVGLKNVC